MLNVFQIRSTVSGLRRYSQEVRDLYKFYSEEENECSEYRTLDEKDYTRFLSKRALAQKPAPSRQLVLQIERTKTNVKRHLSGGMPNEATFPFTNLELTTRTGSKITLKGDDLDLAFQYIPPSGLPALHTELKKFQEELHRPPPLPRNLVVTNAAQHGIQLCVDLLIDPGDAIVSTEYSYTGLHYNLKPYSVEYIGITEDRNGLIPEELEFVLNTRLKQGLKMPRVLFVQPTVNNPTGFLLSEERRRKIYEIACKYDLLIIEDDIYMFLNYTDTMAPSFLSLDTTGRVIRIDSFSKVISAGLRVGWLTGPEPLIRCIELATMSQMLNTCTLAQSITYSMMMDKEAFKTYILSVREFYKKHKNCVSEAFRKIEDLIEFEEPAGGYFHWLKIRGIEDVRNMVFNTAFDQGLLLEPGQNFTYNDDVISPYIRITFTRMNLEELEDDVKMIANIILKERKLQRRMSYVLK